MVLTRKLARRQRIEILSVFIELLLLLGRVVKYLVWRHGGENTVI